MLKTTHDETFIDYHTKVEQSLKFSFNYSLKSPGRIKFDRCHNESPNMHLA